MGAARLVASGPEGLTRRGGSRAAFRAAGGGVMVIRQGMRRSVYLAFLVAYLLLAACFVALNINLSIVFIAAFYVLCSSSRLTDAGFNYWKSLFVISLLSFTPSIILVLFAYQIVDHNDTYSILAGPRFLGVGVLVVTQFLISVFCLSFPGNPPKHGSAQQLEPDRWRVPDTTANEPRT